jgi:hypothetical protein
MTTAPTPCPNRLDRRADRRVDTPPFASVAVDHSLRLPAVAFVDQDTRDAWVLLVDRLDRRLKHARALRL